MAPASLDKGAARTGAYESLHLAAEETPRPSTAVLASAAPGAACAALMLLSLGLLCLAIGQLSGGSSDPVEAQRHSGLGGVRVRVRGAVLAGHPEGRASAADFVAATGGSAHALSKLADAGDSRSHGRGVPTHDLRPAAVAGGDPGSASTTNAGSTSESVSTTGAGSDPASVSTTGAASTPEAETTSVAVTTPESTTVSVVVVPKEGVAGLYCWSLIRPESYELGLMSHHQSRNLGIFGCGGHTVLTSAGGIYDGISTVPVGEDHSRNCGRFACNTDIFLKSWNKLIEMREYQSYSWVVKADPDAAFFPDRLARRLAQYGDGAQPRYVEDFSFPKMQGSMEVVTRAAVDVLGRDLGRCLERLDEEDTGEDGYLSDCLDQVLGVPSIQDTSIVTNGDSIWLCDSASIAVHPIKQLDVMRQCYDRGLR